MAKKIWRAGKVTSKIVLLLMVGGWFLYAAKVYTVAEVTESAETIYETARAYDDSGDLLQALGLYRRILDNFPESDKRIWAQRDIAIASLKIDDDKAAEAAVNILETEYFDNKDAASVIWDVALNYHLHGDLIKAEELYGDVLDLWPDSGNTLRAKSCLAVLNAMQDNDDIVDGYVDDIIAGFSIHPESARQAVEILAEWYFEKGLEVSGGSMDGPGKLYLQKAVGIWERVDNEPTAGDVLVPEIYCWMGDYNLKLDDYEKSMRYYKKALQDDPEHQLAGHALFMVGRNCEKLKRFGDNPVNPDMPIDDRIAGVETATEAYSLLLEAYPDSGGAGYAERWLDRYNTEGGVR